MHDDRMLRVVIRNGKKVFEPLEEDAPKPPVEPIFFPETQAQKIIIKCIDNFLTWYLYKKQFGGFNPKGPRPPEVFSPTQIRNKMKQIGRHSITTIPWYIDREHYNQTMHKFSKLPLTKSIIKSNAEFVPFALKYGFRFEMSHEPDIEINGVRYILHVDSSLFYTMGSKVGHVLGDAIYMKEQFQTNHTTSPVSYFLLDGITKPLDMVPALKHKPCWLNLMSRNTYHRDLIAISFLSNKDLFALPNYFVYDDIKTHPDKAMPANNKIYGIENSLKIYKKFLKLRLKVNWLLQLVPFMYRTRQKGARARHTTPELRAKIWNDNLEYYVSCASHVTHYVEEDNTLVDVGQFTKEYQDSYVELVTETADEFFYITEKTVKPLAFGLCFVMVSCYKFLHHLRRLGFKTFDPYIDESYDLVKDKDKRIDMAFEAFKQFVLSDKDFDALQKICDHNRKHLKYLQDTYTFSDRQWKKLSRVIDF